MYSYPRVLQHDGKSETVIDVTPFVRIKVKAKWLGIDWLSLSLKPIYIEKRSIKEIILSFHEPLPIEAIIERIGKGFGDLK